MTATGDLPEGSWTHSFEEDGDGLEVYRPTATYAFPPSRRGRHRLTFDGGQVVESEPGPDDRPTPRGALQASETGRFDDVEGEAGFQVVESTPEVLRIRRS
jgi:hypothetical protein